MRDAVAKYGNNSLHIELPSFSAAFKKQVIPRHKQPTRSDCRASTRT